MLLTNNVFDNFLDHNCVEDCDCGEEGEGYVLDEETVKKLIDKENILLPKHCTKGNKPAIEEFILLCLDAIGYSVFDPTWTYEASSKPIPIQCPLNHKVYMRWNDLKRGRRCQVCAGRVQDDVDVRLFFGEEGYFLPLNWKYTNCKDLIPYVCPHGHRGSSSFDNFKRGKRCKQCSFFTPTTEFVINYFADKGDRVKPDWKYESAQSLIPYTCNRGHETQVRWDCYYHRNNGCKKCFHLNARVDHTEDFKIAIAEENYKLQDTNWVYSERKTAIKLFCPQGHDYRTNYGRWMRGDRCGQCNERQKDNLEKYRMEMEIQVRKGFSEAGLIIQDPQWRFKNSDDPIPFVCSENHNREISWRDFCNGRRCSKCKGWFLDKEDALEIIKNSQFTLENPNWEYENQSTKISVLCPLGHQNIKSLRQIKEGKACLRCSRQILTEDEKEQSYQKNRVWACISRKVHRELKPEFKKRGFNREFSSLLAKGLYLKHERYLRKHESIDHIIPKSIYDWFDPDQVKLANALCNLRYMSWYENAEKRDVVWFEDLLSFDDEQMTLLSKAAFLPNYVKPWIEELGYGHLMS